MLEIKQFPMRINKYLAFKKIVSRREADVLIQEGKVTINGKIAVLGDQVNENDKVETKNSTKKLVYLAYYKPKGIVTHSAQGNEKEIKDIFDFPEKVFPVGRLDKYSHGLIILTNDGLVIDKILNPKYEHEKEYVVKVNRKFSEIFLDVLRKGIKLEDGYLTKKCQVKKIEDTSFSIILKEGKKRQIRRMCESMGYSVTYLKRVRIMNIEIGELSPGKFRKIVGEELQTFLKRLNLEK
jgi:23S rRNA pseudouridine2604 synthase